MAASGAKLPCSSPRVLGRLTELNRVVWPGYDLHERPDASGRIDYGFLAEAFSSRSAIVARSKMQELRFTPKDQ
ncbi:hypothetical protein CCGE525_17850 [Rhizobium jaguaris]|uniref:Uncharacterized protein n=1 Tax=Rhizobium jaguaris TaxID=1312183 RepID=A0A387FZ48_9HYPH|nr:hypothetical protein CCGE525_17850 [Rhizobium jaguaris]